LIRTVAVVGSTGDAHTQYVADAVARAGGRPVVLDTAPGARVSWHEGDVRWSGIRLDEVGSFYVKHVRLAVPAPGIAELARSDMPTWLERYAAERERFSLLLSTLRALGDDGGRTFVNPVARVELHLLKLHQDATLRRLGFPVPRTLATTEPDAVRAFAALHEHVILKPLTGGSPAEKLGPEHLDDDALATLMRCPVLFQEQIRGEERRVYVLDGEPLAAFAVPTDGVVDARANLDRVTPTELPAEVWQLCLDAARALDLVFTAVDLRRDDDGAWTILELNPTPAIAFHEDPTQGRVMNALARFLVDRA
jgi:hypothetical protein